MSAIRRQATQLSFSEKFSRLRERMRDPEWRRYGRLLLTGKVLGVGLTLMTMFVVTSLFFSHVFAQTAAPR
jgi:Amt family ammonium transporter